MTTTDQDVQLIQVFQDVTAWAKGICNQISVLRRSITRYEDITALDKVWNYALTMSRISEETLAQISTRRMEK